MREQVLVAALVAVGALAALFGVAAAEPIQQDRDENAPRYVRDVQGLFPFPRVGRAAAAWGVNGRESASETKRQGLIPFPRVGRSENSEPRMMSAGVAGLSGLPAAWLLAEPYSGKRGDSEYLGMNRPQRGRDQTAFTPRLGRELVLTDDGLVRLAARPLPADDEAVLSHAGSSGSLRL